MIVGFTYTAAYLMQRCVCVCGNVVTLRTEIYFIQVWLFKCASGCTHSPCGHVCAIKLNVALVRKLAIKQKYTVWIMYNLYIHIYILVLCLFLALWDQSGCMSGCIWHYQISIFTPACIDVIVLAKQLQMFEHKHRWLAVKVCDIESQKELGFTWVYLLSSLNYRCSQCFRICYYFRMKIMLWYLNVMYMFCCCYQKKHNQKQCMQRERATGHLWRKTTAEYHPIINLTKC